MKRFLGRNAHWLLFFIVGLSLLTGFTFMKNSVQGIIAGIFGLVGFAGAAYLAFFMERKKRT
ncbi:hypothetical protein [Bacillus sp. KH172YL63]|uniref:hypothetical protein n=1 Tax=Bacillus sp. KH172YL63 TaxID=2709784 RepID=UPI0013E4B3EA|nr:hypothetical protein [Bacillus sp. KH172YL63]BCB03693.1 hypothetical protein KH172YL63_18260 [Bacillus sp. KH172YL63]